MDSIQGKYESVKGQSRIIADNGQVIPLVAGKAVKLLHPTHGWVNGIYQGNGEVVHQQGTYQLQPGDELRIQR